MKNLLLYIIKKFRISIFNKKNGTKIKSIDVSLKSYYGKHVRIDKDVHIAPDVSIGKYSYVNKGSYIENSEIGNFTSISSGVHISPREHNLKFKTTHPILYNNEYNFVEKEIFNKREKVIIGNDVLISLNAIILEGIKIGDGAVIGAGAIVTRDVEPYEVVGGVPARHIKYRFDEQKIDYLMNLKWWNWNDEKIKKNISFLME